MTGVFECFGKMYSQIIGTLSAISGQLYLSIRLTGCHHN